MIESMFKVLQELIAVRIWVSIFSNISQSLYNINIRPEVLEMRAAIP